MDPDPGLVLRPAARADLPALVPLSASAGRAEWRLRAAADGTEDLVVAERDGQVLGAVSVRWDGACDPPHPWLYALHVRPDARGRGIGARLVRAVETLASRRDVAAVSLDVDRDRDRVIGFYERLGYRRVAAHEHHWRALDPTTGRVADQGVADTWIMRRDLPPR
jgi:ribosomal protein S18 acetylase RimI-like enzyme